MVHAIAAGAMTGGLITLGRTALERAERFPDARTAKP